MMVQLLGKETSKMAKSKTPKKVVGAETLKTTPKMLKKDTPVKSAQKISKTPVTQTPKNLKGKSPKLESAKKIPAMKGIPKHTKESVTHKSAKKSPKRKAAPPKTTELDQDDDSDVEMSDEEEEITVPAQKKQSVQAVQDDDEDDEDDDSNDEGNDEDVAEDEEVMNSDVDKDDEEDIKMESEEEEEDDDEKEVKQEKQSSVKEKASATDDRALFITKINFQTKYKDFMNHFSHFGAVTKGFLSSNKKRKGVNLGFGFITYENDKDKEAALGAVHTLDGRTLSVLVSNKDKEAGKRKREHGDDDGPSNKKPTFEYEIFAGRLSFDSTADEIKEHFSKFGTVCNVVLPLNFHTKKNKGFAFVAFTDKKAQLAALAESDQKLGSRTIAVCPKKGDKEVTKEKREVPQFEHELFVGGLSSVTERQTLDVHFSKYGKVEKVTLPWIKHAKRNKGFAFVAFQKAESVKKALEEDHEIDGSTVNVSHTKDKPSKKTKNETVGKAAAAKPKIEKIAKEEEDEDDEDNEDDEDDEAEGGEDEEGDNVAGEGSDDDEDNEDDAEEEEEEDDDDEE